LGEARLIKNYSQTVVFRFELDFSRFEDEAQRKQVIEKTKARNNRYNLKKVWNMQRQTEKPKEDKSRAVANSAAQRNSGGKQNLGFVNNRSQSVTQEAIQQHMNKTEGNVNQLMQVGNRNAVTQLHHNYTLDDGRTAKAHIYEVYEKKSGKAVYIGQTCDGVGINKRFDQHLTSGAHNNWSHATHAIKAIWTSVMTQFETTTAEQYYIDGYGGIGSLENAINALTQSTFDAYVNKAGNPRDGKKWRPK
jgi:hypothetical protein